MLVNHIITFFEECKGIWVADLILQEQWQKHSPMLEPSLLIYYSLPVSFLLLFVFVSLAPPSEKGISECEVLLHSLLKAPCSSSMVILLLYLSSASCLPSNKHHPRLAIPLVIWKRTGDQWQGCCHGTVYSCRVEFCCKAREFQNLLASSHCHGNLLCLVVSTAERNLVEASQ